MKDWILVAMIGFLFQCLVLDFFLRACIYERDIKAENQD